MFWAVDTGVELMLYKWQSHTHSKEQTAGVRNHWSVPRKSIPAHQFEPVAAGILSKREQWGRKNNMRQ